MKKELKEKLEKALQDAGLDKGLLAFVSIEKEEDIQGVVDNLVRLKTPQPSIEELLKQKEIQSEIDRRITEARKKWEEGKATPPETPKPTGEMTPEAIAKMVADAVAATNAPLLEKLNGFEKSKSRDEKLSLARNAIQKSKIPEKQRSFYMDFYNPDGETTIEDWVKQSEEKHEAYVQNLIDSGQLSGPPPKIVDTVELSTEELDKKLEKMGAI